MLGDVAGRVFYWAGHIMSDELKRDILIIIAFGVVYYIAIIVYVSALASML